MTEDDPESSFEGLTACARLAEEPIDAATKDRLAEVARLLALNIGYYSGRKQHGALREKKRTVTYSPRTFIVGPDDTLYRLASAKFSRMLDDPEHNRLPRFAGQRVRMVDAIVEVRDRTPCAVVRLVYEMLGFDTQGRLDRRAFERQNVALVDLLVDRVVAGSVTKDTTIVDASSRFVAQGGRWQPSPLLARRVLSAALGELKCERL